MLFSFLIIHDIVFSNMHVLWKLVKELAVSYLPAPLEPNPLATSYTNIFLALVVPCVEVLSTDEVIKSYLPVPLRAKSFGRWWRLDWSREQTAA